MAENPPDTEETAGAPDGFGALLATVRLERRLSRGQLSAASGCSPQYVEMLETGDRLHPSPHLVAALASALGLEGIERTTFFAEAGVHAPTPPPPDCFGTDGALRNLVAGLDLPAAILDACWWLHGWNGLLTSTFETAVNALPPGTTHLLELVLSEEHRRRLLNLDEFAPGLVAAFKTATRDQSATERYAATLPALRALPGFAALFAARRTLAGRALPLLGYGHSVEGELWFQPLLMVVRPGTAGVLFAPANPGTTRVIERLAAQPGT
jgi:hypothetical protein